MLANAKAPSLGLSASFFEMLSLTITREMKDELLLVMLFLGFLLLFTSLVRVWVRSAFASPNAGADSREKEVAGASLKGVPRPSSLLNPPSAEKRFSLGVS